MNVKPTQVGGVEEAREFVQSLLKKHKRVAVIGAPGVGKTTVTKGLGAWSSDSAKKLPWDKQAEAVVKRGKASASWLFEGVAVARALRHGLPADAVVYLTRPDLEESGGRAALGKQVAKWASEAGLSGEGDFHPYRLRSGGK